MGVRFGEVSGAMLGEGLRIAFDPAIDGAVWPDPLRERTTVVGEAWLGPLGLLDRLEIELGLLSRHVPSAERVADLAAKLETHDGFWRRSFESDPIGTARRLLADRGTLMMWGWNGEAAGARLRELWEATAEALPGVPDRLLRILDVLPRRSVDVSSIALFDPMDTLAPLWQRVFRALAERGVSIVHTPLAHADARGDLRAARAASGFVPAGDGSVQLLRPHGVLAAADEIAAMLAAIDDRRDLVVIGSDVVLDRALARHGLPRLGADRPGPGSTALVRLVVETAFRPMDPVDLHALLCIDPGPIPRAIASRLITALKEFPSRSAPTWTAALASGLDAIEPERRDRVGERLRVLLEPVADEHGTLAIDQLTTRMRTLASWARGRAATTPSLAGVIAFAEGLLKLVEISKAERLDRARLRRACNEAERESTAGPHAEAGLHSVPRPGAILGPVGTIVWWGFTRDLAPRPPRLQLSEQERRALRDAGITPPDAGAEMAGEARRWRRPLLQARDRLLLVCPRTNEASDASHPHPLWDELCASMTNAKHGKYLECASLPISRTRAELRPLLTPSDHATVAIPITVRSAESPSSVEQLIGCSLAWALHYPALMRGGLSDGVGAPSPLLLGTVAHHLLAKLFADGALPPDAAAIRAAQLLDNDLEHLAESLSLPDHQVERAALRRAIIDTAREVAAIVQKSGATIRGVEVVLERDLGDITIRGRADLLLSNPSVVVDYKWGKSSNRERLYTGTALQLATYAELSREAEAMPGVAYLILRNQQLLIAPETALPDALRPGKHSASVMWAAARAALRSRMAELREGKLVAPGALEDSLDSVLDGDAMRLAAPCDYCEHAALCGRRVRP